MNNYVNANSLSFHIESLGCIANQVDGKRVEDFLLLNGWAKATSLERASLIILMTCGFTKASETFNLQQLQLIQARKREDAKIIVGGCLPNINKTALTEIFDGDFFSPRTLHRLDRYVDAKISINEVSPTLVSKANSNLTNIRISTGCMSHCSYCAIPFANGKTRSRTIDSILKDIRISSQNSTKHIRLVSEDIGAYGLDNNISIIELLQAIVKSDEDILLYLDNFNPNWLIKYIDNLLPILKSPKIAKSFYIPIQSGSDRILKLMKREYTVSDTLIIFDILRKEFSNVKVTTDFIVGFPTESEEDFSASVELVRNYSFDYIEVFTYEDRPRIAAAELEPKVSESTKEGRRMELLKVFMHTYLKSMNISNQATLESALKTINQLPINTNLVIQ